MATINRTPSNEEQKFKQIENDSWSGIYLPAICAGVVMTIVLLMAVSCSKKSATTTKISAPVAPAVQSPTPAAASNVVPETSKKTVKKHRPTTATYVNGNYGLALTYPRKYSLQSADKQKEAPVQTSFAKSGAVEIATLDMPDGLYPDTDFSSALLNVSVHQGLNEDECGQFAAQSNDTAKSAEGDASTKPADSLKPAAIKLGANQFTEIEQMSGSGDRQSDLKYFHLFKNGACYEFALDVETSRKADEELAQVDRSKIFKQLEKILTTARIKEVELPGMENAEKKNPPEPTATIPVVAPATQTEKAQVVAPEPK
ncbi:MAG TPA: hypothetical protein VHQ22_13320 [Terriglobales bacterium]|jgi:hypothetical protein|nr:hypothetical protein [Terriglobales bacterium]